MLEFSSFLRRFPNVIFNYLQFLSFDHLNKHSQFCACGSPLFKILWLTGRFGDSWFCSGSKSKAPQLHWNDWHQWNGFGWFWNRVMCGNKRAGEALECGRSWFMELTDTVCFSDSLCCHHPSGWATAYQSHTRHPHVHARVLWRAQVHRAHLRARSHLWLLDFCWFNYWVYYFSANYIYRYNTIY